MSDAVDKIALDALDPWKTDHNRKASQDSLTASEVSTALKRSEDTLRMHAQRLADLEIEYRGRYKVETP